VEMGHISVKTICFFLIVKLAFTASVLADDVSDGDSNKISDSNSAGRNQYQGFGFFNTADRTDSMGEKGAVDSFVPIIAVDPAVSPATSTSNPATTKKQGKNGNKENKGNKKKNNKVNVVIDAPVVEPGTNITNGLFVNPQDNTLNLAIGGANISIDLSDDEVQVVNTTTKGLNGDEIPEIVKGHIPVFLQLAKDSSRRDFFDIETNDNIKKCYYMQALMNWANSQSADVKNAFYDYIENLKLEKEQTRAEQDIKVKQLSETAQEAHKHIQSIIDDDQISKKQETQSIAEYFSGLPTDVQEELNTINS